MQCNVVQRNTKPFNASQRHAMLHHVMQCHASQRKKKLFYGVFQYLLLRQADGILYCLRTLRIFIDINIHINYLQSPSPSASLYPVTFGLTISLHVEDVDQGDGVADGEQAKEDWQESLGPVLQPLGRLHLPNRDQAEDADELKVDDEDEDEAHHEPDVEVGGVGDLGDDLPDALVEFEDVDEGNE